MASHLLKQLAASLTRQITQINRLNWNYLTAVASYRCLYSLSTVPKSSARISHIQPAACGPSLLGQCQHLPCIQPTNGMKTKSALKRRCKDCFFVRRRGRLFVFCKTHPRHKQRQGWNVKFWRLRLCYDNKIIWWPHPPLNVTSCCWR